MKLEIKGLHPVVTDEYGNTFVIENAMLVGYDGEKTTFGDGIIEEVEYVILAVTVRTREYEE